MITAALAALLLHCAATVAATFDLRCAQCGGGVARARGITTAPTSAVAERRVNVSVGDGGLHVDCQRLVNPHGVAFNVFTVADGAHAVVPASAAPAIADATWFDGYAWRIGVCAACGRHVGWLYAPRDATVGAPFAGVVAERVLDVSDCITRGLL